MAVKGPKEVVVRQPSLFVRSLRLDEARKLKQIRDRSKQQWRRTRAGILLASHTEMSVKQIAELYDTDQGQVRRVIREFNEQGFKTLDPTEGGGRPRRIDDDQRDVIVAVALARPRDLGVPLTRWSLRRMADYLAKEHRIDVSAEHLRRILRGEGITYQRTRTWKQSPDPDYESKKNRILRLYRRAERGKLTHAAVVCFDECGPLSLRPWAGSGWFEAKRPDRMRATYRRPHGVSYFFGAYDVGADRMWGDIRRRKDAAEVLRFVMKIRARYEPRIRIYLVLDNLSTHTTRALRAFARKNRITLVFTPTYASFLNRIECNFAAYKEFVLNGSDFTSHDDLIAATRSYLRYRNHRRKGARVRQAERRRKVA
jgi:transposase